MGKRFHGGQKKRYKDTLKAFLKDFNIPTVMGKIALDRGKWRGSSEEVLVSMRQKKSAKPSRNVHSEKPDLRDHQ